MPSPMTSERFQLRGTALSAAVPWTPSLMSPIYYYDSTLGVTPGGGFVSGWADQSGFGHDLSQPGFDLYKQPRDNVRTINGVVALDFNDVDGPEQTRMFAAPAADIPQPFSIFAVLQYDTPNDGQLATFVGPNFSFEFFGKDPAEKMYLGFGSALSGATSIDHAPHNFVYVVDGASSAMYLDGALDASGDIADSSDWAMFNGLQVGWGQGGGPFFDGGMALVLIVPSNGAGFVADWTAYCQDRYATP